MTVRVLHLIASNFVGGPEKQILHHAKDMAGSRYHIEVASFLDEETKPEILGAATRLGVRATCLPGGISIAALTGLVDVLRDRKFDLLCTHGYKANFLGHLATKRTNTPHAAFVRGWTAETWRVSMYERLERWALRDVPTVVCVSKKQAERIAPTRRHDSPPLVVPNAILAPYDGAEGIRSELPDLAKIPDGAFVFGSIGRLSIEKGHRFLLDAFANLRAELPSAKLFLILLGSGRELTQLQAQAARLGIVNNVLFAGFQRDCSSWMQRLDCLVQPSLTEGTPNSVLEALHHQLPVVATAVGGVPDLILDHQNGLLVPPADAPALARGMLEVFTSPELRAKFASGAELVMHEYSPAVQRERLIAVYKSAIDPQRKLRQAREREVERESAA